jgi:hypothetical protein
MLLANVADTVHGRVGKGSTTEGTERRHVAAFQDAGKRTLTEAIPTGDLGSTGVQRKGEAAAPLEGDAVAQIARQGTEGAAIPLPHRDRIQSLFGRHDISGVTAHEGPAAGQAAQALGARAYATAAPSHSLRRQTSTPRPTRPPTSSSNARVCS